MDDEAAEELLVMKEEEDVVSTEKIVQSHDVVTENGNVVLHISIVITWMVDE